MSLAEIGVIILKRNEIQTRRQSIRHKLRRARKNYEHKCNYAKWLKLKKDIDINSYKKFATLNAKVDELDVIVENNVSRDALCVIRKRERILVERTIENAEEELKDRKYLLAFASLPKKFHKAKAGDMKLDVLKLEQQFASVVLELAEFTKETHSQIRQLLSKCNSSLAYLDGQNKVKGVWVHDKFIDIQRIEKIVLDYHAENILLKG